MKANNKDECKVIIHAMINFPKYVQRGNELAVLIKELQEKKLELTANEYWQIKDKTYRVVYQIFNVNFILLFENEQGKLETIWLSELLPLSYADFKHISKKLKRSSLIGTR